MPIVFLSPSTQDWNPYVTGSGSEEYWMNRIVDAMEPYLRSNGIRYRRNDPDTSAGAAIREAQAVVDRERPVGADARVRAAAETAVNVAASVTLMDGGSLEGVKTAFSQGLTAFFRDNALRTRVVSHGKALRLLLDCAGVADVSGFTMNGSGDSLTLQEGAVPVVGTLTLTEVKA